MTTTKHTLNELFFKRTGKLFRFNAESELEKPLDFDTFYIVMIGAVGICDDKSVLDYNRLNLLYDTYVKSFNENKNKFVESFVSTQGRIKVLRNYVWEDDIFEKSVELIVNKCKELIQNTI